VTGGTARKTSKTDTEAFAIFCKELCKYRDVCDGSSGDNLSNSSTSNRHLSDRPKISTENAVEHRIKQSWLKCDRYKLFCIICFSVNNLEVHKKQGLSSRFE
jgi:hypothetical protein